MSSTPTDTRPDDVRPNGTEHTDAYAPVRDDDLRPVDARLVSMTPEAIDEIRMQVEEANRGGNRLVWFVSGFLAALVAGVVAAVVFLAVSSTDDDGNIELDVPAVDVSVGG